MDKQTIKKIKEIVHKYDPEGFVAMDTPDGEYDDYISRIVSQYNDGRLMPHTLAEVFKEGNREIDYNSFFCEIVAAASESDPKKFGKQRIVQTFLGAFPEMLENSSIKNDDYSDTPYVFFSVIHFRLQEAINSAPLLGEKIVYWINKVLNAKDVEQYVEDMLWIEFFEGTEGFDFHKNFLLSNLKDRANLLYRQYLYIMDHGGLTDAKTGEILKYRRALPAKRTGKFISDIT